MEKRREIIKEKVITRSNAEGVKILGMRYWKRTKGITLTLMKHAYGKN